MHETSQAITRLYTFGPSHFCEKARWALDLCGADYHEERWAPGPHLLAARCLAPATSVPILRCAAGTIQGSDRIIAWLEQFGQVPWSRDLTAAESAQASEIEQRADRGIGVAIRRLVYAMTLPGDGGRSARQLFDGVVWWQRPLARLMWPVTRRAIMKGLRAGAGDVAEARVEVESELNHCDALADGRRFLVGDRFTRADIALASLLSPIARPAEHPVYPGAPSSQVTERLHAAYGDRPSLRWARQIYRDFRTLPSAPETNPAGA